MTSSQALEELVEWLERMSKEYQNFPSEHAWKSALNKARSLQSKVEPKPQAEWLIDELKEWADTNEFNKNFWNKFYKIIEKHEATK